MQKGNVCLTLSFRQSRLLILLVLEGRWRCCCHRHHHYHRCCRHYYYCHHAHGDERNCGYRPTDAAKPPTGLVTRPRGMESWLVRAYLAVPQSAPTRHRLVDSSCLVIKCVAAPRSAPTRMVWDCYCGPKADPVAKSRPWRVVVVRT